MEQQSEELESTIELMDSNGKIIDTIKLPAHEMVMLEAMAREAGVPTEDFIKQIMEEMMKKADNVGS